MNNEKAIQLHQEMIKEGKIPSILFKYASINNNLYKTLINAELWFSAPTMFNDPFDCQINDQTTWTDSLIRQYVQSTISQSGEQIDPEEIIRLNQITPGSFSSYFTNHFKKTLSKIGVSCFVPDPNNLLMWAHYSESHKGLCLKFDIKEDPKLFSGTFNVKYSSAYPVFDYLKEKKSLVNKAVLAKSDHWSYEKEIRVLQHQFGLKPFNRACLKEVIFGCNTDPSEIKTIKQIVQNNNYPNVIFKQVQLKPNSFGINIITI